MIYDSMRDAESKSTFDKVHFPRSDFGLIISLYFSKDLHKIRVISYMSFLISDNTVIIIYHFYLNP